MDPTYLQKQKTLLKSHKKIELSFEEFYDKWIPDIDSEEQTKAFMNEADKYFVKFKSRNDFDYNHSTFQELQSHLETTYQTHMKNMKMILEGRRTFPKNYCDKLLQSFLSITMIYVCKRYSITLNDKEEYVSVSCLRDNQMLRIYIAQKMYIG